MTKEQILSFVADAINEKAEREEHYLTCVSDTRIHIRVGVDQNKPDSRFEFSLTSWSWEVEK